MSDGWNGNRHDATAQNLHRPTTRRQSVYLCLEYWCRQRCTNAFLTQVSEDRIPDLNQNTAPCRAAPGLLAERYDPSHNPSSLRQLNAIAQEAIVGAGERLEVIAAVPSREGSDYTEIVVGSTEHPRERTTVGVRRSQPEDRRFVARSHAGFFSADEARVFGLSHGARYCRAVSGHRYRESAFQTPVAAVSRT